MQRHQAGFVTWAVTRPHTVVLVAVVLFGLNCSPRFPVLRSVDRSLKATEERAIAEEYFLNARDLDRRGLTSMAVRDYEKAYGFDPSSATLCSLVVEKNIEIGKYTRAQVVLKENRDSTAFTLSQWRQLYEIYVKTGQFSAAAKALDHVLDRTIQEDYSLGLIYESLGNLPAASQHFRDAWLDDSANIDIALRWGALLLKQKSFNSAESLLTILENRVGQTPRLLVFGGECGLARGDTAGAARSFRMAMIADSSYVPAVLILGDLLLRQRHYQEAAGLYETLAVNPQWADAAKRSLLVLYYYDNRLEKAAAVSTDLLSSNPDDASLHYYLGLIRLAQDSTVSARIEFEKTLVIDSTNEDGWRQLSLLGLREKDLDRALADADRFRRALPANAVGWRTLGVVYNARKEYQKAEAALQKAVRIDTADSYAWFELGSAQERSGHIAEASKALGRALMLRPDDPVIANYLGYMWAEQAIHLDSALALLRMALAKDSANGAYLDSYAWIFFRKGNLDSASFYISRAAATMGDDPVIQTHRGDILAKMGRVDEAVTAYEKALENKPEDPAAIRSKIATLKKKSGSMR